MDQGPQADAELVRAAQKGDRAAFAALVRRYERGVQATTMRVLGDRHSAADAAQEALVSAYRKITGLRNRNAFGVWLLRIAQREATRMARKRARSTSLAITSEPIAPSDNGGLDGEARRLLEAVARLPEHERWVVTLRYFDGHGVADIARMTGRPVGTVTKQLSRAHRRLRRWLEAERER